MSVHGGLTGSGRPKVKPTRLTPSGLCVSVIDYQIYDKAHGTLRRVFHSRIDTVIIRDVVAAVAVGGGLEGKLQKFPRQ
jgi:hypothetical protein